MKIHNIIEGKSENRELWDRIKSKGVVPSIDRERYTDMSGEGLEGPFRMKNGQVLYYDPKEGKYYNRDTDMYVDYDDYRAMNEESNKNVGAQIADLIRKKNSASSPIARKNIDAQIAQLKKQRDKTNEEDAYDKDVKSSNKPHDKEAAAKRAKAAALAAAKKAKEQGVTEANNDTGVKWFDFATWALKQGDKYKDATTNHTVYKAAQKAYKAYVKSKKQGVAEGDDAGRDKFYYQRNDIWRVMDGDELVHEYKPERYEVVGAKKLLARFDDEGYDVTHVISPMGTVTYLYGKPDMDEGDKRPGYVVKASDKPKKVKPSMGGESPHPYQGKLVGATESSQWGEPEDVLRQVLQTLEKDVEWPLTDVMDPQQVKQLLSPLMQAVSQKLNSLDEAEVGNTDYEFTHGKKPSGHGSWFFVAHRGGIDFGKDVEDQDYIQLHGMNYGEAKKAAIKWAKSKGHSQLFVAT